jgi:hypothetical protein
MLKLAITTIALALASPAIAGQNCYYAGNNYVCQGTGDDMGYNSNSYRSGNNLVIQQNDLNTGEMRTTNCWRSGNNTVCN